MTPTGFQLRFEELKPGTARELLFLTKFLLSFLAPLVSLHFSLKLLWQLQGLLVPLLCCKLTITPTKGGYADSVGIHVKCGVAASFHFMICSWRTWQLGLME